MNASESRSDAILIVAMLSAAAVTAQFVGGKAIRDALFLANLDVTSLPLMVIGAAAFSLAVVFLNARLTSRLSPSRLVPLFFVWSAAVWLIEWALVPVVPRGAAVIVYLHVSGSGSSPPSRSIRARPSGASDRLRPWARSAGCWAPCSPSASARCSGSAPSFRAWRRSALCAPGRSDGWPRPTCW
jgi:hypothetical protein